jgi:hypothetical protein
MSAHLSLNVAHTASKVTVSNATASAIRSSADNIVGGNDGVLRALLICPGVDINQMKNYWLYLAFSRKALPPVG